MNRSYLSPVVVVSLLFAGGCRSDRVEERTITLATTTSTRDSGLLDELVPLFEQQFKVEVKVVAVGTGQALALARRGDADVLLAHAPDAEKQFVSAGHGIGRQLVMHNDFVIVGPISDRAKLAQATSAADALQRIVANRAVFVSRGDDSGTHLKETKLWEATGIEPVGDWYLRGGVGMSQTLRMASEKSAYTLADRGTFLAQRAKVSLKVVLQGDSLLLNRYSVIVVNPAKHPHTNHRLAEQFAKFLLSDRIQKKIAQFGVEEYGEPLFFRAAARQGAAVAEVP